MKGDVRYEVTAAAEAVAQLVADAGGKIVGRTRLQKVAYLLEAAGHQSIFDFEYKNFGPFSDRLAEATQVAGLFGAIVEEEKHATWGGTYFIFKSAESHAKSEDADKVQLVALAAAADAVQLELAATAVFLANGRYSDPWGETARRKPEKAAKGRLEQAKLLYEGLRSVPSPRPLPAL